MANESSSPADRVIHCASTLSVIVLAGIAAVISYKHMYQLVLRYGETSWTAALLPVSVDGMIVVASMSLLVDSRRGRGSGLLPWTLLVLGSAASLAANVAVADPSLVGRLIAAWPSCALIGSYELLMRQIRRTAVTKTELSGAGIAAPSAAAQRVSEDVHRRSAAQERTAEEALIGLRRVSAPADDPPRETTASHNPSEKSRTSYAFGLITNSEQSDRQSTASGTRPWRSSSSADGKADEHIQRRAWRWAVANRTPQGDLPPGKTIGSQFGRSDRWGRMVKQAGRAGQLGTVAS